jgi:PAS domain S-box-containing protein
MELPQGSDAPISVLYVDDEPALLEIGKIFLERAEGIHVTTADSAEDAIRLFDAGEFDAIVSDYQMPGMDGIAFLKYIRCRYGAFPFLLFTGKGREEIVIEALNNGVDYYVEKGGAPKPQFADLVHNIRRAVAGCRTEQILSGTYAELQSSYAELAAFDEELNLREERITAMQQLLQESEQMYEGIFAYTGSATVILEEDMGISLANTAFAELAGYRRDEIEGCMEWTQFVHPDDLVRLTGYHRSRRRDPKSAPEHYEFRLVNRSGNVREIYMTIGLIPGTGRSVASQMDITELKEARDRLSLLGNILDDSLNEFYVFDAATLRFVQVNRGGRENLGYSMEELSTLTPVDLKPECTYESFWALVSPLLHETKDRVSFTTIHRRKDGSEYPIEVHIHLSRVITPPVFVAVIIDITNRREVEEEARILGHMVDHASSAITIHDYNGQCIYANERTLAMHGYTRDEFMVLRLKDLDVPASAALIEKHLQEVNREGETVFEAEHYRKDGSILPLRVHISVAHWEGREVLLSIAEDITEWKEIERALQDSRKQLSFALEAAQDGLWDWSIPEGQAYFSPQYLQMLGYEPGEFAATYDAWWEYVHPNDRADAQSAVVESIATQGDFFRELRMKKKDGSYLWVLTRGRVMETDSEGQPLRMVGTHTDISQRKQVENALRLANRKLQLLSGITRHDILNQAVALIGYLSLAEEMDVDPTIKGYLEKMHQATLMIEKTVEFTRKYEQLGQNEPNWFSVQKAAANSAMVTDLSAIVSCEQVEIFADPLITTVFSNLMDNTIRHAEGATAVSVSCVYEESGGLTIAWEDDGVGVPGALKEKIFGRGRGSDTGLGLFLIREILAITGISIRECGIEGTDACFELKVPPGGWRSGKGA